MGAFLSIEDNESEEPLIEDTDRKDTDRKENYKMEQFDEPVAPVKSVSNKKNKTRTKRKSGGKTKRHRF
jgi:hypothetical protein